MEKRLKALLPGGNFANVTPARSQSMSHIRGKDNATTERVLRMAFVRAGQRGWLLHSDLLGKPDFYFPVHRLAIFVDGCFWHGCTKCGHVLKTRTEFWLGKLKRNRQRDRSVVRQLRLRGIRVIRVWEHRLKKPELVRDVLKSIQGSLSS